MVTSTFEEADLGVIEVLSPTISVPKLVEDDVMLVFVLRSVELDCGNSVAKNALAGDCLTLFESAESTINTLSADTGTVFAGTPGTVTFAELIVSRSPPAFPIVVFPFNAAFPAIVRLPEAVRFAVVKIVPLAVMVLLNTAAPLTLIALNVVVPIN